MKPVATVKNWSSFPVGALASGWDPHPTAILPGSWAFSPPTPISDWLRERTGLKFQLHWQAESLQEKTTGAAEVRPGRRETVACALQRQFVFPRGLFSHLHLCMGSSPNSSSPSECLFLNSLRLTCLPALSGRLPSKLLLRSGQSPPHSFPTPAGLC